MNAFLHFKLLVTWSVVWFCLTLPHYIFDAEVEHDAGKALSRYRNYRKYFSDPVSFINYKWPLIWSLYNFYNYLEHLRHILHCEKAETMLHEVKILKKVETKILKTKKTKIHYFPAFQSCSITMLACVCVWCLYWLIVSCGWCCFFFTIWFSFFFF